MTSPDDRPSCSHPRRPAMLCVHARTEHIGQLAEREEAQGGSGRGRRGCAAGRAASNCVAVLGHGAAGDRGGLRGLGGRPGGRGKRAPRQTATRARPRGHAQAERLALLRAPERPTVARAIAWAGAGWFGAHLVVAAPAAVPRGPSRRASAAARACSRIVTAPPWRGGCTVCCEADAKRWVRK